MGTLPLRRGTLRAAYAYLCATPPFDAWNLPDPEDMDFRVVRASNISGWYTHDPKGARPHSISISRAKVGHTYELFRIMSHEMIHLYQTMTKMRCCHNAAFAALWREVAEYHGFDPLAHG